MNATTYARLRRVYLNTTYYARHGRTRYNGARFGAGDTAAIKPTQLQMVALRKARKVQS